MNQNLERRYEQLFSAYDVGGPFNLAQVKDSLRTNVVTGLLRQDAAFLLLVLYDQMILRPYAGQFVTASGVQPPFGFKKPDAVDLSLNKILEDLNVPTGPRPRSSHEVLKAIERTWQHHSEFFDWER